MSKENDPLSDGAVDLSTGIDRPKAVLDEKGLKYTTADLIEAAKVILESYDGIREEIESVAVCLDHLCEVLEQSTFTLPRLHHNDVDPRRAVRISNVGD